MVVMSTQMNGSYFRVWETLRESWDCAAKIAVSCSHGRNLEQLVDLDWFDSNFCIKSLAQIRMYQVCANPCLHKCRNPFSRNVQIQTYTGYKSLPGNVRVAKFGAGKRGGHWRVMDGEWHQHPHPHHQHPHHLGVTSEMAMMRRGWMAVIQCWT